MQGIAPFQWLEPIEQETPPLLHSHSVEFHRTSTGNANRFVLNLGHYMRMYALVFIGAAIILLIAHAWRCFLERSRRSISGSRRRRLASGGGQENDGNDQESPPICESLEELLGEEGEEDFPGNAPPPQPTSTSMGAAAEEERPQKKKRKTKHHAEDGEKTSEQQAKKAREDEQEMLSMDWMSSFLLSWEEPNPRSSPEPPFTAQSAAYGASATLEEQLERGEITFEEWLFDPKDDLPLTSEELRRSQESADLPPMEGTGRDYVHHAPFHAMEGQGSRHPSEDTELPSTSRAVSGSQAPSSQPPPPHVSQPSQVQQPVSRPEDSADVRRGLTLRPFNPSGFLRSLEETGRSLQKTGLAAVMKPLELLLREDSRSEGDLQAIIEASENLYDYVTRWLLTNSRQRTANQLIRVAVRRLLVVNALWRACDVVGSPMRRNEWWPGFMAHMYGNAMQWSVSNEKGKQAALLERIVAALESYSRGVLPEPDEMANILRPVFDKRSGIPTLKGSEWDLWRDCDEDS